MTEEQVKCANLTAFKAAVSPMIMEKQGTRYILRDPECKDGFISSVTIKRVMSACFLYGFSGFYITISHDNSFEFRVY